MEVIYYYDEKLKYCPVKKYLKKYLPRKKDNRTKRNRKEKILSSIWEKILFIKNNNGLPDGAISKPVHGYSFFQIRAGKDGKILIRILYFCHKSFIVLLNAFEKPDNYTKTKEKKKIDKEYKVTSKYLIKFKLNSNNYEKYE